jgi:hypothetical protein
MFPELIYWAFNTTILNVRGQCEDYPCLIAEEGDFSRVTYKRLG